jgi:acetolactate synthase-1/2/3 large subunit
MNGAEWLARALAGAGTTHVFFVESVLRRTLLQLKDLGVSPILAHSEKAAAYMADGYARIAGRPGVCMAQAVGAANLVSGLQDPFLGRTPVVALTGRKPASFQHRNAYQEIPHAPLFAAVTNFRPRSMRPPSCRACCATPGAPLADTPRPTHLDFSGHQGDEIELGQTTEPPVLDPEKRHIPAHRPLADAADIERAAAALSAARRIAIVAGDGAAASQAGPEVLALAEALQAPVAHDAWRPRHHSDPASAFGRCRRQLFRAAGEPHRPRRRSHIFRGLRHRRSGHLELDRAAARRKDRADRRRSAGDRA